MSSDTRSTPLSIDETPHVEPALSIKGLSVTLGEQAVLHDVSLQALAGEWLTIVGPNGAGKSTLLRCWAGLQAHTAVVRLLGREASHWPRQQWAQNLAWFGQAEAVDGDLQVEEAVMLGRLPHRGWLSGPTPADQEAVDSALAAAGVALFRGRRLGTLSGGERQRVLLARALAVQPKVIVMDEPLLSLDVQYQSRWIALVKRLCAQGVTVVSVLHELAVAMQADQVAVLAQGRLRQVAPPSNPALRQALIEAFEFGLRFEQLQGQWVPLLAASTSHHHAD